MSSPHEYSVELWFKLKPNWRDIVSITYYIPKSRLYWPYGKDAYKYCTFIINAKKRDIRNQEGDYEAASWISLYEKENKWNEDFIKDLKDK
ncbi:MAG: hypothetical protein AAB966_05675 [Patescibacteria group bacterium]